MFSGGALNIVCLGISITFAFGFGLGTGGNPLFSKCCSLKRLSTFGDSVDPAGAAFGAGSVSSCGVDDGGGTGGGDLGIGDLALSGIMS